MRDPFQRISNSVQNILRCLVKSLFKLTSRVLLWCRFLYSFRGTSFRAEANLFLSALVDTLFYFISGWTYNPKMLFSGIYVVKPYGIFIYARGGADDLYHALPEREGDVHRFIVSNLKSGDVFVDVGGNIGYYAILASKLVGNDGKVFAVEPVPSTSNVLRLNIKLNQANNVIVIDKAAWHTRAKLKLQVPFGEFGLASSLPIRGLEVEVDAIPLDGVLNRMGIKLIKIDVEGAEYEVLRGLTETLKHTELIVLELSRNLEPCLRLLQAYGFKVEKMKFTSYYACRK